MTHLGEARVEEGVLAGALRSDLGVESTFPIFIPAATYTKSGKCITIHLMEGYIFVASGLPETTYFALEKKPYVNQVMSVIAGPHKMRVLSTISNSHIEDLKRQLREQIVSDINLYDQVRVSEGTYRSLEGLVLGIGDENAYVQIDLRSMKIIATIPLIFLKTRQPA